MSLHISYSCKRRSDGLAWISHTILARLISHGGALPTFLTIVLHRGAGGRGLGWSFCEAAVAAEKRVPVALGWCRDGDALRRRVSGG